MTTRLEFSPKKAVACSVPQADGCRTAVTPAGRPCEILGPLERNDLPEVGNAQRGIDCAQMRHGLLRFRLQAAEGAACPKNAKSGAVIRPFAESLLRKF
jgi:hypothetical protein